ncbi:MAG: hypothetical protein KF746_20910 [Chitinophagaceae bacterium]|nr:hypothetical protein [Chitinophagaceae bacterium]
MFLKRCYSFLTIILILSESAAAQVPLKIENHTAYARKSWPVSGGVPFPKGLVRDLAKIGMVDRDIQVRPLSFWGDSSVKWALIDYQADLDPQLGCTNTLQFTQQQQSVGNTVIETEENILVNTGMLKFKVSKVHFSFLEEAWLDLNNDHIYQTSEKIIERKKGQSHFYDLQANNPDRPTIPYAERNLLTGSVRPIENGMPVNPGGSRWIRTEGGGKETRVQALDHFYSAKVVEHGALRTVVQIKGRFGPADDDNEYSIWIHAYRGKSFLRIQHNFTFHGDPQVTNIRRMGLQLPVNFKHSPSFKASGLGYPSPLAKKEQAYLLSQGAEDVFNLEHKGFPLSWEVNAGDKKINGVEKTAGWIDVSNAEFGVTLVMKDMAYMYPKELSYDAEKKLLNTWLWPDHGKQVLDLRASGWPDGMQGVSFTHDLMYAFHGKVDNNFSEAMADTFNDPTQPYVNPEWYSYRSTKAAGMLMPHDDQQFPNTEAYLATGTSFIERSMTEFGWLGMLNYGDLLFMYGYNKGDRPLGTWGISTRPDDYDGWRRGNTMISYRMLMQYLRTGEYNYWKAASASIKFIRDACIKHFNSSDKRYIGFGRRHSAYWGAAKIAEIDRSGGVAYDGYGTDWLAHYTHWNLTGDWRTYEVMNEIRHAWNTWGNSEIDQLSGGAYVGLKLLSTIPGYENAWNEANQFLDTAIKRTAVPGDEWRDCTWFMGYGLYLQDHTDEPISKAILDWWKVGKHKADRWGLYWHREALAAVYWAADNDRTIRDSVYAELTTTGSTEAVNNARIQAQNELYKKHGVSGLFTCDMIPLANAVAPGYWRAKDDIMQQQWDEPLSMAVISHYRENYLKKKGSTPSIKEK